MPRKPSLYDTPPDTPLVSTQHEGRFDPQAKIKVPGKRKGPNSELADLRRRARSAGATARVSIPLPVRVSVELYKAIVELAEEYHQPLAAIARQCLEDGVRKYREFSTPGLNPFGRVPLTRALPNIAADFMPTGTKNSLAARAARAAELPAHVASHVASDEDVATFDVESAVTALATLPPSLYLPNGRITTSIAPTPPETDDAE